MTGPGWLARHCCTNRLELMAGEQAREYQARLRERLADPEQRSALRAEQHAALSRQHAALGSVLDLEETTARRLIELLTERQMEQLELLYGETEARLDLQAQADATTRHISALRELLGEQGRLRYENYAASLAERRQVEALSAGFTAEQHCGPIRRSGSSHCFTRAHVVRSRPCRDRDGRYDPFSRRTYNETGS